MNPILLLKFAALTHFGLVAAGLLMPRVTKLWTHVAVLPPFAGALFRTYYAFIGLCLVGFGVGSWFLAEELAGGSILARAACGFLACFWALRLIAAVWVLDVTPYLTGGWLKAGYQATNAVFGTLPFLYAWLALRN
jgi:hypothetical protein